MTPLEFGHFRLDGGAMFGVIPRVLWQRFHPPDENNQIDMVMRGLLVEVDDRKILVDTGFGTGQTEKFRKIYAFTGNDDHMDRVLASADLKRDQITDVIITHLHFDHTGGATINKNDHPEPTFPNARYYIQKRQLDHARSGLARDRASYLPVDFEPLIDSGVAEIVDGHWGLMDGFDCLVVNGHTPAMQLPRIIDGNDTLLYAADLIPLASQFPLPWIMAYDLYPVTTLQEKIVILTQAAEKEWTFFFEHDPLYTFGKVIQTDKGFTLAD
ncbi:MAG: MBL fold metallo-hydrolase [Candidatus Electryoneaceae bacterium]|nr:MBL fold metallo-hydrolase [Candidatus Electryoneaceae bacterium]